MSYLQFWPVNCSHINGQIHFGGAFMRNLTVNLGAVAVLLFLLLCVGVRPAAADIIQIQNVNGSPYVDLSQIEDGNYLLTAIILGSPSAGSINVTNDTGASVSSLDLYFDGLLAPNQFLNGQFSGAFAGTCTISDGGTTISTGTSNGCITGTALPLDSYKFAFDFSSAIAKNASFNISWASFSDIATGCIAGTPNCLPVSTPEPGTLSLLALGLVAGFVTMRRFRFVGSD